MCRAICKLFFLIILPVFLGMAFYAWYNYTPMPAYAEEDKAALEILRYSILIYEKVARVVEFLGYGNYVANLRSIINIMTTILAPPLPEDNVSVSKEVFDGVKVLLYIPKEARPNGPGLVYFHGGGWMYNNPDTYDPLVRTLARILGVVTISVDYRLSPENIHPAQLDDCEHATRHFMANAARWNVDPYRIAIAGDSAGGHLAAALAVRWTRKIMQSEQSAAKAAPQAPIRFLMLVYPMTQLVNFSTTSYILHSRDPLVPKKSAVMAALGFLFGLDHGIRNPALLAALFVNNHTTRETRAKNAQLFNNARELRKIFKDIVKRAYLPEQLGELAYVQEMRISSAIREGLQVPSGQTGDGETKVTIKGPKVPFEKQQDSEGDPGLERQIYSLMSSEEVSPLLAPEEIFMHPAWPSTWVASMGYDIFRDDTLSFYRRVKNAARKAKKLSGTADSSTDLGEGDPIENAASALDKEAKLEKIVEEESKKVNQKDSDTNDTTETQSTSTTDLKDTNKKETIETKTKENVKEPVLKESENEKTESKNSVSARRIPVVGHKHYSDKYHIWFSMHPDVISNDLREFVLEHPDAW